MWYEDRFAGLGWDFVVEYSEPLARIQRNPEWVGVHAYGVRSLRIRRFPYVNIASRIILWSRAVADQ